MAMMFAVTCRPTVGSFTPNGYEHPEYGYTIRYHDSKEQTLMSEDWLLDNLTRKPDGKIVRKRGADYESHILLDVDDDGKRDDLGAFPTFDMRFEHKKTAAVIALRTIPIETKQKDRELRILVEGLVERISGGGYEVVQLEGELHAANKERRYAAKVLRSARAKLAGQDAYSTVVDVSNVDRLRVDPNSVEVRVEFVMVRTPFQFTPRLGAAARLPVVLLASHASSPADFEAQSADFRGLLGRIDIDGHVGFSEEKAAGESTPDASTALPEPEPAPSPVDDAGSSPSSADAAAE